ncbi:XH/XS domain-containing protein [Forsythia ovata]|uniref:XH/XS domain-containing protein n=1 Tax=Forsythia ovata TaxID=205694 RepID=A0ABD1TQV9_9LAMI
MDIALITSTLVSNELGAGKPRAAQDAVFAVLVLSFMMTDTNDSAKIVKPWTIIVANIPIRIENNIRVDNCNINLERRWKRQGYLISSFQPLYDYAGHSGFALVEFARDLEGLKSAFHFDISFVEKGQGKAEWDEASEQTNELFAWMASEEDYNKNDIVGCNLTNGRDLTSAPNIQMQEARHYRMVLYNLRESLHSIAQRIHRLAFVSRVHLLLQMLDKNEESIENFASTNLELLDMVDDGLAIQSRLQGLKIYIDELYSTINY